VRRASALPRRVARRSKLAQRAAVIRDTGCARAFRIGYIDVNHAEEVTRRQRSWLAPVRDAPGVTNLRVEFQPPEINSAALCASIAIVA
jgi:hypothetical protein